MTLSEYCQLKNCIISAVRQAERHSEILSSLKNLFINDINSVRRFEQITQIGQLFRVLEIRDVLSEDNVDCLKRIALKLPRSQQLLRQITDYEENHVPRTYRNYYVTASDFEDENKESFITSGSTPTSKSISKKKKQRIFETITEQIGSYWRDLGRNLKIQECLIDDIDCQNKSLTEKADKILEAYEYKKADPDRWFFILCNALEKSRRKDLARSVQEIMAMNI